MKGSARFPGWMSQVYSLRLGALFVVGTLMFSGIKAVGALSAEDSLIKHSPFLPPGWGASSTTSTPVETPPVVGSLSRELEFRGIFEMNGVPKFSIFDKTEQKSAWHPLNSTDARFSVVGYDVAKRTITLKAGGRTEELQMVRPDDRAMPVVGASVAVTATPPAPPNMVPPTAPPNSVRPNFTPPNPPGVTVAGGGDSVNGNSGAPSVPRRRVLRPGESQNTEANMGGNTAGVNGGPPVNVTIPPPPNFVPGPPPNMTPPPMPTQ